ncbi:M1 family aminopeptidase [Acidiluteibacter ferrifornacis]|uniref:Aminopeptidase N n=1 Tax=Acidiluteibacter ferrifornacis TaxID=2692424 RepID=A0A6N9NDY2_9FLAO|nr:M1 family aminopeptidase [Acidiluteibacter ferrifornacis]NBG64818.1 hypothetical protein [Acidiluteibacter ferrifornacis]
MRKSSIVILSSLFLASCSLLNKNKIEEVNLDEVIVTPAKKLDYQPSETRINDLLHTKLDVKFDWTKAHLHGIAHLTFKPYFLPTDSLTLDAKGFEVKEVVLITPEGSEVPLKYEYKDKLHLNINLDKTYTRNDTYQISINYIAKPNELEDGGSAAITSDKGLYFINPNGEETNKPKQIWTQGETEASSCWFPTIDAPNEKMTQEIYMTVDTQYVTLSNGILMFQTDNGDGTRTDYWKQKLPHAPYLAMMAVGDFAIVEDSWKSIGVNYYVEPKFEPYAKQIFPHTPEMLTFFSERLGVEYPWEKYDQIVVRDYVSGAMENTTGVIFGEFAQGDSRYLIDNSAEDVVSHELFHHWFGDLVTCESWSNLPLNESFATYGEYLWREYKNGKTWADYHNAQDLKSYLRESKRKQVDMIRFYYDQKEDMFDSHSYAKGGRILHMLRTILGEEVFFEGLRVYLEDNKFQAVEIHQLRLAMEKVSGQDLNWFFNQWFLSSGHPVLKIDYAYDKDLKLQFVTVEQNQNLKNTPLYRLPVAIDIYTESGVKRHNIVVTEKRQIFEFKTESAPTLVNFDAQKYLLCEKEDNKGSIKEWIKLYEVGTLYDDKKEALTALIDTKDTLAIQTIMKATNDEFWGIRLLAIDCMENATKLKMGATRSRLIEMAKNDENSSVRAKAIEWLIEEFEQTNEVKSVYSSGLNDSSYVVVGSSLYGLYESDKERGLAAAKQLEAIDNIDIMSTISLIYSTESDEAHQTFYESAMTKVSGFDRYAILSGYAKYIKSQSLNSKEKSIPTFKNSAIIENAWWMRIEGTNALLEMRRTILTDMEKTAKKIDNTVDESVKTDLKNQHKQMQQVLNKIDDALTEVKAKESNSQILEIINKSMAKN